MHERERHHLILKLVNQRSILRLPELAELLGVSENTVRRDIVDLEKLGQVRRIRGGVEALHPRLDAHLVGMPFDLSRDVHAAQKRAIARAAVELIGTNESVIISGGTTTFAMAEFLADQEIRILTNSFSMAAQLYMSSRNRITLPAGEVYREQNIILSPFDEDGIRHFWGKKLFTSGYGVNRFGLMEADPLVAQAQAKLFGCAQEVVVLADSSKLQRESALLVAKLEQISTLIVDDGASPEQRSPFEEAGVKVIVARVADDMALSA